MAKTKAHKLPLPKTSAEVNAYITAIAEAKQTVELLTTRANERLSAINAELAETVAPYEDEIKQYAEALFTYFEKNKDELTDGGRTQSVAFGTGVIGQRWSPPRTKLKDEAAVLAYLINHRLTEFYETKNVLRRDAMLANRSRAETIPGVSFVRDLTTYVRPDQFEVEIDLKKKVEPA